MIKTINFELSKRLTEYLDNIETEYCYSSYKWEDDFILLEWFKYGTIDTDWDEYDMYKTLTFSEAIEFLAEQLYELNITYRKNKISKVFEYHIKDITWNIWINSKLILALEQSIEYLLDNNLVTK